MAHYRFDCRLVNLAVLATALACVTAAASRAGTADVVPAEPAIERAVVDQVNAARREQGLETLTADARLAEPREAPRRENA